MYDILTEEDIDEFNDMLYLQKRTGSQKQRMWALLDRSAREVYKKLTIEQAAVRTTIRRFLRAYCFLIQATRYENIDLHKRYNFLMYLVKELDINGGNDFDIADKITVTNFEQQESGADEVGEIEPKYEVRMKAPRPAVPEAEQIKMLSIIIDEINAISGNKSDPNVVSKSALQIREILLQDAHLKASARSNPLSDFKFTYKDSVNEALVKGYAQNTDFYTFLLGNVEYREKLTQVFMEDVYRTLRENK
jgi:type I restriction enzyme R subunit